MRKIRVTLEEQTTRMLCLSSRVVGTKWIREEFECSGQVAFDHLRVQQNLATSTGGGVVLKIHAPIDQPTNQSILNIRDLCSARVCDSGLRREV